MAKKKTKKTVHPCNEGYGNCGKRSCPYCTPKKPKQPKAAKVSKQAKAIVEDVLKCVDAYGISLRGEPGTPGRLEIGSVLTATTIESAVRVMERRVEALLSPLPSQKGSTSKPRKESNQ